MTAITAINQLNVDPKLFANTPQIAVQHIANTELRCRCAR
jgi:hypothetical protein